MVEQRRESGTELLTMERTRVERDAERAARWVRALIRRHGNVTHAAEDCGWSKQYGFMLNEGFALKAFAVELRERAGQPCRGRPPRTALTWRPHEEKPESSTRDGSEDSAPEDVGREDEIRVNGESGKSGA
jgi:hypothetical protein